MYCFSLTLLSKLVGLLRYQHRKNSRQVFCIGVLLSLLVTLSSAHSAEVEKTPETEKQGEVRSKRSLMTFFNKRAEKELLNSILSDLRRKEEDESMCLYQAERCNPWKDECCPGMTCLNYIRGYCIYGAEPCICYPMVHQDVN